MASNGAGTSAAGPSKNRKPAAIAQVHDVSKTIRGQTKKDKAAAQSRAEMGDRAGMSKDVVKAVLASPLTVAWPNIPRHLQTATLHALKELVPNEVADYHVSRARCHQKEKRFRRRQLRRDVKDEGSRLTDENSESVKAEVAEDGDVPSGDQAVTGEKRKSSELSSSGQPASKKARTAGHATITNPDEPTQAQEKRPIKPVILSHLVLGINEVIKSLETQIDQLKFQLMIMGDALSGRWVVKTSKSSSDIKTSGKGKDTSHLLPTAPRSPSPELGSEAKSGDLSDRKNPAPISDASSPKSSIPPSPIEFVVVPLLSVNPPFLVSPIPQYCATYNALVYQHQQLARICRTRLKRDELDEVVGKEREECRVVPLGAVELEMAQLVGLRRLACLGVRSSHPDIDIVRKLLPKSVLHSPRHALTLPIPSSSLNVYTSATRSKPSSKATSKQPGKTSSSAPRSAPRNKQPAHLPAPPPPPALPVPDVHYADLHIKGIQTKMPVDNAARKAKRLDEVRRKRVEAKMRKKEAQRSGKAQRSDT
ncbi:hypothetical protein I317_06274 [Kwoniella heveanensis CBS 569]|nr:hypothetical protein I317_06274 [Kwoniella heveanensis CBS 569]